ncbi:MAG: C1 family peptidase [Thermoguttaceae bacterium]|jgi:hypothetical protein
MPNPRILIVLLAGLFGAVPIDAQASMPGKVDLTPEFERFGLFPQNQGADTCSLHAVASLAEFELAKVTQDQDRRRSTEFLIWAAKEATGKKQNQAMFYEAVFGLNKLGICRETLMPEEEEKSHGAHPPSAAAIADARKESQRWKVHWIRRWDVARPMEDAQLSAIQRALTHGHPVACGLRWPKTLKGYEVIQVPPPNAVEDGHSIALVGYFHDPKQGDIFLFRNSWGPKWGKNGYGTISAAYVRAYANDAIWLELGPPKSEVPLERFEAESAPVLSSGRCRWNVQDMAQYEGAMWSKGKQLLCQAEAGGFIGLALNVRKSGAYRLRVLATAAPDFGAIHVILDGRPLAPRFDLYSGRVSPSGSLELGNFTFAAGQHRIRFVSSGKNPASAGHSFGIDAVDLLPQD